MIYVAKNLTSQFLNCLASTIFYWTPSQSPSHVVHILDTALIITAQLVKSPF